MAISFVEFQEEDRDFYVMCSKEFYGTPAVCAAIPEHFFQRTFETCLAKSPYAKGFIVRLQGRRVGYALLSFTYSNEVGGLCVLLEELFILPPFQRQGISSAFFRFVEDEFVHKGHAKRLRLEVTEDNTFAIALYRRKGFGYVSYLQMVKDFIED